MPHFAAVIKVELNKAAAFISAVEKRAARCGRIRYQVEAVHLRRAFPGDATAADMAGLIEIIIRKDVLEISAGFAEREASCLSFLGSPLIAGFPSFFACHKNKMVSFVQ